MCGIVGQFNHSVPIKAENFIRALNLLNHRGPDANAYSFFDNNYQAVHADNPHAFFALGHTRLTIVDSSDNASQPMFSKDKKYAIAFNGEIYNYQESKKELLQENITFYTQSDTEVLLNALIKWGPRALQKINGMWAFIFVDLENNCIMFSRDHYGKKPLFYCVRGKSLYLSSEIKAIYQLSDMRIRQLDADYLTAFLLSGNWPQSEKNETLYKEILSVMPGSYVICRLNTFTFSTHLYKTNDLAIKDVDDLKKYLISAIDLRLQTEVPLGIFVSGGVDSTLIAAFSNSLLQRKDITYITADTGQGNDVYYSKQVANCLNIKLNTIFIPHDQAIINSIQKITKHYELPVPLLGNSIAMNLLYHAIKNLGIKVMLDGTGGEKIFGGYYDYYHRYLVNSLLLEKNFSSLLHHLYHLFNTRHISLNILTKDTLLGLISCFTHLPAFIWQRHLPFNRKLSSKNYHLHQFKKNTSLTDFQLFDIKSGRLPMWLYMNDMNSMMHSIEARSPFLDINLKKYVSLSAQHKFNHGYNKYILRKLLPESISHEVRWRRDKQGLRWGVIEKLLEYNFPFIKEQIHNSKLLKLFINIDAFFNAYNKKNTPHLQNLLLRMFSIAMFEEQFVCEVN